MIVDKTYEVLLNLNNEQMYEGNLDDVILNILSEKFENKCSNDGLILKVNEIIRRSMCEIIKSDLEGNGSVCVTFSAKSLIYNKGYVIPTVTIIGVSKNIILAETEHSVVKIKQDNKFFGLTTGDVIPIRIISPFYTKGKEQVTLAASIFTLSTKVINYKVIDIPTEQQTDMLIQIMDQITELKEKLKEQPKKILEFFLQMFYPFKEFQSLPKEYNSTNMFDAINEYIKEPKEQIWCRHPSINKGTQNIGIANEVEEFIVMPMFKVSIQFLLEYRNFIEMLIELCSKFSTDDKLKKNKRVWNLYKRNVKE